MMSGDAMSLHAMLSELNGMGPSRPGIRPGTPLMLPSRPPTNPPLACALHPAPLTTTEEHAREADLAICLGTSLQITPACNLPLKVRGACHLLPPVAFTATLPFKMHLPSKESEPAT